MKTFKKKLLTIVITLAFGIPVFCFGQAGSELNRPEIGFMADSLRNDTITVYICPMHPEIQSDKPVNCPKCGMKLVIKTSAVNSNNDGQNKMDMMCMPMGDMNHTKEKTHPNKMIIVMGTMMGAMMVAMLVLLKGH
ncbi:MAG: heavy metal-binding domain-containing protein [Bacteroidales bacterium]